MNLRMLTAVCLIGACLWLLLLAGLWELTH
jgi:hypothetical protein